MEQTCPHVGEQDGPLSLMQSHGARRFVSKILCRTGENVKYANLAPERSNIFEAIEQTPAFAEISVKNDRTVD